MNKKTYYIVGAIALAFFILLAIVVKLNYTHSPIPGLDPELQTAAWQLQNNTFLVQLSSIIATCLGETLGALLGLAAAAIIFIKDRISALWLAFVSGIALGGNVLIKLLIGRERPALHRFPAFLDQTGKSFASGHTTFAVVLFGCLFLIILQQLTSTLSKFLIGFMALALILITMFSRILLWVHYPSDTLGGLLWGIAVISFTYPTYCHLHKKASSHV